MLVPLVNQNGTSNVLLATGSGAAIPSGATAPAVGDQLLFGESESVSMECLVQRISPRNDLTALVELVEYNPAVYDAADSDIPAHSSRISLQRPAGITRPLKPELLEQPISDETVASFVASGSPAPQILVTVRGGTPGSGQDPSAYSPTTHYHAQARLKKDGAAASDWFNVPRVEASGDTKIFVQPVEEGEAYEIRVRAVSDRAAAASDWLYVADHTVVGLSTPPPAPTDLAILGNSIRWSYANAPADLAGFVVKFQSGDDATWSTGIPLTENLITDTYVEMGSRVQPGPTTIMVRAVDLGGNESTTLSAVKTIKDPDGLFQLLESVWTGAWSGFAGIDGSGSSGRTNCSVESGTNHLIADEQSSLLFWSGGDTASFWSSDSSVDFWGVTTFKEMSFTSIYYVNDDNTTTWPSLDHLPGRQRIADLDIEGADYRIEFRAITSFTGGAWSFHTDWLPWPGLRDMQSVEFQYAPSLPNSVEITAVRITIAGGSTRGKLKAGRILTEALPKSHRVADLSVSASGTTIDLTGKRFRKITNVSVNPTAGANSTQSGIVGEAYNLDAAQTSTWPYERTGPTVRLYNASGTAVTGTASVLIEGY